MKIEEYEPFLKPEVSRDIYDLFKSERSMLSKCTLNTIETIVLLFNMLTSEYKLQKEDIAKIKSNLDMSKRQHSKRHIDVYNEIMLLKKKLYKAHFDDPVYSCKIKKEKVAEFSKTIIDVHGKRNRTLSNVNEAVSSVNLVDEIAKVQKKAQDKGDKHFYPDLSKNLDNNFGQNMNDDPDTP